ncbi:transcriptional regulator [Bacillus sp. FJAT-27264]|uniref:helix-turn-helix transcriptional regulator n=1 Tax=Paenibacillus sp. (strain DSM 101736 / FJAT-27264) TaxID=1850362 RepID=UPI000807E792|nr:metalloregulator ArsR/SmtB family transcription factor [Bacillus sp. FJAT-27264]OBZ19392.1 transcriptional regulator [Bacillus sp. FJAT-27264]
MTTPDVIQQLPTREIILHLLKTKGDMSTKDLTDELGITIMAVRRHIQSLERDNLISSRMLRQTLGRPTTVYYLTEQAGGFFPKNYHTLTVELLTELEEHFGSEAVEKLFDSRKNKLIEKYGETMKEKDIAERVEALAHIQNENGYMVELVKVSEDEFLLTEHNCPIEHVAAKFKNVCHCELKMFQSLLGDAEIKRLECLGDGGQRCTYSIKKQSLQ